MTQLEVLKNKIKPLEQKFLDVGIKKEQFIKEMGFAVQMIDKNETLAKCSDKSILTSLSNVALTGLTLNPSLGYAYLVPRKGVCILDISYKGFVYLAQYYGGIKDVRADCIYSNDAFDAEEGLHPKLYHKPNYFGDRGKFLGAYCIAVLPDGTQKHEIMSDKDIEKCRSASPMKSGAIWNTWTDEQRKKTCVRRARKLWPHCEKLADAVKISNETDGFEPIERKLKPEVAMPQAIGEVVDPGQPEDFETETTEAPEEKEQKSETSNSDKLYMEVREWQEVLDIQDFNGLIENNFIKKKFPNDFKEKDLNLLIKLCVAFNKKKGNK